MEYTKAETPSLSVGAWEGVLPLLLQDFMSISASDGGLGWGTGSPTESVITGTLKKGLQT